MDKQHILDEIRRTAEENGGKPLGSRRFQQETGIKESDWYGRYWVRWSDAVQEAGYSPNKLQGAFDEDRLMESLVMLIRELRRFPVEGDLILKRRLDPRFPSHNTFRRFGTRPHLVARVLEYCKTRGDLNDVMSVCAEILSHGHSPEPSSRAIQQASENFGFVYLLKSGRYYKIGKTNAVGRRERELAIQLPERAQTVHVIRTDDPEGIEAYWHRRYAARRRHGEWFELDAADIGAFKRRKFM